MMIIPSFFHLCFPPSAFSYYHNHIHAGISASNYSAVNDFMQYISPAPSSSLP